MIVNFYWVKVYDNYTECGWVRAIKPEKGKQILNKLVNIDLTQQGH